MAQVQIDDAMVSQMMGNPQFRREFPFMATAHMQSQAGNRSCNGCGRKQKSNTADYEGVRSAIGAMDLDKKAKLKEMLGGGQVAVRFDNGNGKWINMRF